MSYFRTSDGIELYYNETGEGFPLVLIHGYQWSADMWFSQVPVFSKYYKVIAYDLRGLGRSDKPKPKNGVYPNELHTHDLVDLLAALKIKKVAICGCSMGGTIAQQFAVDHPDMLEALILYGTFAAGGVFVAEQIKSIEAKNVMGKEKSHASIQAMAIKACLTDKFLKYNPDAALILAEQWEETGRNVYPEILDANYRSFMEFDLRDRLHEIKTPTLVIHGAEDFCLPVKSGEYLRDHIPGARLVVLPGGHHANLEAKQDFNEAVLTFLDEHVKKAK